MRLRGDHRESASRHLLAELCQQEVAYDLVGLKEPSTLLKYHLDLHGQKIVSSTLNEEGTSPHLLIKLFREEVDLVIVGLEGHHYKQHAPGQGW